MRAGKIEIDVDEGSNKPVEVALRHFAAEGFRDGDTISHDWLAWALEVPVARTAEDQRRYQFLMLSRVEEFKDRLLRDHQIALQTVRGQGYRIVPPEEQAEFAAKQMGDMMDKALRTGRRLLRNTRRHLLTDEEARRHDDTADKTAELNRLARKGKRDVLSNFSKD